MITAMDDQIGRVIGALAERGMRDVELFRGAVRQGDWKLVWRAPLPSRVELFDLAHDPSETTNLADQNPDKVRTLQRRVDELAKEMAKSQFLTRTFKAFQTRPNQAPVFPNEDGFYERETP
jgi:arylsulfatase A-like enzyme